MSDVREVFIGPHTIYWYHPEDAVAGKAEDRLSCLQDMEQVS